MLPSSLFDHHLNPEKPINMGCLNPIAVKQDDGTFKFFPCRHCLACLLKRMFNISQSSLYEMYSSASVAFVTLTYRNRDIPKAWFHLNSDTNKIDFCDSDGVILSSERYTDKFYSHLYKISRNYADRFPNYFRLGQVPYLCRKHVTDYLKRLRITSTRQGFAPNVLPIRFLLCGEYGESFARPHFHLLLFFKSETQYLQLKKSIGQKWHYGHCVLRRFHGSGSSYLSSYLAGSSNQSYYYGKSFARQFVGHSNRLGFKGYEKISKVCFSSTPLQSKFFFASKLLYGQFKPISQPYNYACSLFCSPRHSDLSLNWFSVSCPNSAVCPNRVYTRLKLTFARYFNHLGNGSEITRYILSHPKCIYYSIFGPLDANLLDSVKFNHVYYDVYNSLRFLRFADKFYSGNLIRAFISYQVYITTSRFINYANNTLKSAVLSDFDSDDAAYLFTNKPKTYLESCWTSTASFQSWSDYVNLLGSIYSKSKKVKHQYTLKDYV